MQTINTTVRMTPEMKSALEQMAKRARMSVTDVVTQACALALTEWRERIVITLSGPVKPARQRKAKVRK